MSKFNEFEKTLKQMISESRAKNSSSSVYVLTEILRKVELVLYGEFKTQSTKTIQKAVDRNFRKYNQSLKVFANFYLKDKSNKIFGFPLTLDLLEGFVTKDKIKLAHNNIVYKKNIGFFLKGSLEKLSDDVPLKTSCLKNTKLFEDSTQTVSQQFGVLILEKKEKMHSLYMLQNTPYSLDEIIPSQFEDYNVSLTSPSKVVVETSDSNHIFFRLEKDTKSHVMYVETVPYTKTLTMPHPLKVSTNLKTLFTKNSFGTSETLSLSVTDFPDGIDIFYKIAPFAYQKIDSIGKEDNKALSSKRYTVDKWKNFYYASSKDIKAGEALGVVYMMDNKEKSITKMSLVSREQ